MDYCNLLERMQNNDSGAFLEMTERYGWAVYSAIRQKYPDQAVADRIYDETMNSIYRQLSTSTADDPLEALLCAFADRVSLNLISVTDTLPQIKLRHQEFPAQGSQNVDVKKRFWVILSLLLIFLLLFVLLWLTIGVMMAMEYIPFFDFGYSWFNTNIFDFF